jgi:hypothetical protein
MVGHRSMFDVARNDAHGALVSMQTAAFSAVPREKTGRASSLFSTVRQVAAAFGVAIAATVLSSQTNGARVLDAAAQVQAGLAGFHYAIAGLLLLGLFSLVFALRLRDQDAPQSKTAANRAVSSPSGAVLAPMDTRAGPPR